MTDINWTPGYLLRLQCGHLLQRLAVQNTTRTANHEMEYIINR